MTRWEWKISWLCYGLIIHHQFYFEFVEERVGLYFIEGEVSHRPYLIYLGHVFPNTFNLDNSKELFDVWRADYLRDESNFTHLRLFRDRDNHIFNLLSCHFHWGLFLGWVRWITIELSILLFLNGETIQYYLSNICGIFFTIAWRLGSSRHFYKFCCPFDNFTFPVTESIL